MPALYFKKRFWSLVELGFIVHGTRIHEAFIYAETISLMFICFQSSAVAVYSVVFWFIVKMSEICPTDKCFWTHFPAIHGKHKWLCFFLFDYVSISPVQHE